MKTYVLVAVLREEAAAFVQTTAGLQYIQPPYGSKNLLSVTRADLATAINRFGYKEVYEEFSEWIDLIEYLRAAHANWRKDHGMKSDLPPAELLSRLPRATLHSVVQELEKSLENIRSLGDLHTIEVLLIDLLRHDAPAADPDFVKLIAQVLKTARSQKTHLEQAIHFGQTLNDAEGGDLDSRIQSKVKDQRSVLVFH